MATTLDISGIKIPIVLDDQATARIAAVIGNVKQMGGAASDSFVNVGAAATEGLGSVRQSAEEARGSMALLGEETGVRMPRHLRSLIANIEPIAGALSLALAPAAGFAIIGILDQAGQKLGDFISKEFIFTDSDRALAEQLTKTNKIIADRSEEIAKLKDQYDLIGLSGSALSAAEGAHWVRDYNDLLAKQRAKANELFFARQGSDNPVTPGVDQNLVTKLSNELGELNSQVAKAEQAGANLQKTFQVALGEEAESAAKKAADAAKQFANQLDTASQAAKNLGDQFGGDFIAKSVVQYDDWIHKLELMKPATDRERASVKQLVDEFQRLKTERIDKEWEDFLDKINSASLENTKHLTSGFDFEKILTPVVKAPKAPQVDPSQFAAIQQLNGALALADLSTKSLGNSFGDLFAGIATGTRGATDAIKAFADSMISAVGRMISKLIEMWIWQEITGFILGSAIGNIGGSLPLSSFGGFSGLNLSPLAPHAGGGSFGPNDWMLVGERGPEIIPPLGRAGEVIAGGGGVSYSIGNINVGDGLTRMEVQKAFGAALKQVHNSAVRTAVAKQRDSSLRS